jgi:hypothetical protein
MIPVSCLLEIISLWALTCLEWQLPCSSAHSFPLTTEAINRRNFH